MSLKTRYKFSELVRIRERPLLLFPILLILFLVPNVSSSQTTLRQVIRGIVMDKETQSPLPGATVTLEDSNPLLGTTTDTDGEFILKGVPIGKQRLRITYVGYAPWVSDVLTISSAKQTVINAEMMEMVTTAPEVEIKSVSRKYEVINKMATVSVRAFSPDETNRFAGSYGDPARMAANFAGVTSGIDNRNDIIVRGNTPMGLQWRIDGMEIPNPNHFAAVGTTGGPVTVLNNNLLTQSDFLTGSFPAQYGNALAGVFDMKMKVGNPEKHEYWFQVGWNGLEFGTEGPFSNKSQASYIFSYRYSLLDALSIFPIDFNEIPKYQDINLKINLPTKKAGTFTLFGLGGISYIELYDSDKPLGEWTFPTYGENIGTGSNLGVLGLTNVYYFSPSTRLKSMVYVVGSKVYTKIDTFTILARDLAPWAGERSTEVKYSGSLQLTHKFSAKNTVDLGVLFDFYNMNFNDSVIWRGNFRVNTDAKATMYFWRGFAEWHHKFSDDFSFTAGMFGSWLSLQPSYTLEPRLGFDWNIGTHQSINFGTGLYSQMQPRVIYFVRALLPDGTYKETNLGLDFTRSAQVALGYNFLFSEHMRFKAEAYYQYLYSIPVKQTIPEFAIINQGHDFFVDRMYADSLVNEGTGTNYGVELTLERFFWKNYYFLFTTSLFSSIYKAFDQQIRNTAFNVNYVLNVVGGYDFRIGKKKRGILSLGLRGTYAGGNPYVPYDPDQTTALREPVYAWGESFVPRYPDYKRVSFRFGIKRNRPKLSMEFIADIQWRTNYTNIYLQRIDVVTGVVYYYFKLGFFPMGTWRIQF